MDNRFVRRRKEVHLWLVCVEKPKKVSTELELEHLMCTVKHEKGLQMIWGGILDKYVSMNILNQNFKQSATKLGILDTFKRYKDNDHKYRAAICRLRLVYSSPTVLERPNVNLIEHLRDLHYLKKQI